jgi:hypothetical protein
MERVALDMDTDKAAVQEFEGRVKAIVSSITTETTLTKDELRKLDGISHNKVQAIPTVMCCAVNLLSCVLFTALPNHCCITGTSLFHFSVFLITCVARCRSARG